VLEGGEHRRLRDVPEPDDRVPDGAPLARARPPTVPCHARVPPPLKLDAASTGGTG
jgi:hypothetical protein